MFKDRRDAGRQLAERLHDDPLLKQVEPDRRLVLSIPRGGVVVGDEVARALGCAHDVIVVKKIGFPGHEELAIGAVAEDGWVVLDDSMLQGGWLTQDAIEAATAKARSQVEQYIQKFRQGRPLVIREKTVIVVDDGIATGETMRAAVEWLNARDRNERPRTVLIAVPVTSPRAMEELAELVDGFICLAAPAHFWAVGQFYENFTAVGDGTVVRLLTPSQPATGRDPLTERVDQP